MSYFVAGCGKPSVKNVLGQKKQVIPFIGGRKKGTDELMTGIGVVFLEHEPLIFCPLDSKTCIIRLWRSLKILERINTVSEINFHTCYELVEQNTEIDISEFHNKILCSELCNPEAMSLYRSEILSIGPRNDELHELISVFLANGADICVQELTNEIISGHVSKSLPIYALIHENASLNA